MLNTQTLSVDYYILLYQGLVLVRDCDELKSWVIWISTRPLIRLFNAWYIPIKISILSLLYPSLWGNVGTYQAFKQLIQIYHPSIRRLFAFYLIGSPAGRDQLIVYPHVDRLLQGHLGPLISCPDLSFFIGNGFPTKWGRTTDLVDGN